MLLRGGPSTLASSLRAASRTNSARPRTTSSEAECVRNLVESKASFSHPSRHRLPQHANNAPINRLNIPLANDVVEQALGAVVRDEGLRILVVHAQAAADRGFLVVVA